MIQNGLHSLVLKLDTLTTAFTNSQYWKLKISILSCVFVLVLSFPEYYHLKDGENPWSSWNYLQTRIKAPLSKATAKLGSNEGNKVYRLTPIYLAKIYNSSHTLRNVAFLILIEHILGFLFFYLLANLAFTITNDKIITTYFAVGFSFLFIGKDFFWDIASWLIPFGYFFMLLAMVFRNPIIIFFALLFGFWSDERMVLLSPLVILWWRLNTDNKAFIKILAAYITNFVLFFIVRSYIATNYIQSNIAFKVYPKDSGVDYFWALYDLLQEIPLGLVFPFEGYWIFVFIYLYITIKSWNNTKFWWLMGGVGMLAAGFIVSFAVRDSTKGFSMLFPLFIITLKLLTETENKQFIKRICLSATVISFLLPTYFYNGGYNWMTPIYYEPLKKMIWWGLNALV